MRNALLHVFVNVSMYVQGGVCIEYLFMPTSVHENALEIGELVLTKFQSHFPGPRTSVIRTVSLKMTLIYLFRGHHHQNHQMVSVNFEKLTFLQNSRNILHRRIFCRRLDLALLKKCPSWILEVSSVA